MSFIKMEVLKRLSRASLISALAVVCAPASFGSAEAATADVPVAVVVVPTPRSATLLQLRGISGRGKAHFRIDGKCYSMSVRFVAGDFGGDSISVNDLGPIQLRVVGAATIDALFRGQEVVSDMVEVGPAGSPDTDIIIDTGLFADTGFVINPGSGIMADVFGARKQSKSCRIIEQSLAHVHAQASQ